MNIKGNGNQVDRIAVAETPLIQVSNVHKVFSNAAGVFTALDGVDLNVDRGEFVSIVGKSGSGKTTLINMLTGIDEPSSGEIIVAGVQVHGLNEGDRATWRGRNMGIVFQFFQLLPTLTALENVRLPMDFGEMFTSQEREERAMYLLERVGMADEANTHPARLSGGQQQRVAIARALANNPGIIASDEPTGNLDTKSADAIIDLFQELVQGGKTVLMVTHDDDLAARAGRTIALADGKVIQQN
jgi:putative ABC transport system ATP-binding protein